MSLVYKNQDSLFKCPKQRHGSHTTARSILRIEAVRTLMKIDTLGRRCWQGVERCQEFRNEITEYDELHINGSEREEVFGLI